MLKYKWNFNWLTSLWRCGYGITQKTKLQNYQNGTKMAKPLNSGRHVFSIWSCTSFPNVLDLSLMIFSFVNDNVILLVNRFCWYLLWFVGSMASDDFGPPPKLRKHRQVWSHPITISLAESSVLSLHRRISVNLFSRNWLIPVAK